MTSTFLLFVIVSKVGLSVTEAHPLDIFISFTPMVVLLSVCLVYVYRTPTASEAASDAQPWQ